MNITISGNSALTASFSYNDIQNAGNSLKQVAQLNVVRMGLYAAQIMGYGRIMDSYRFVTYNGATTLRIAPEDYDIAAGKPANCIALNAPNFYHALNENAETLYSIRNGKVIVQTKAKSVSTAF